MMSMVYANPVLTTAHSVRAMGLVTVTTVSLVTVSVTTDPNVTSVLTTASSARHKVLEPVTPGTAMRGICPSTAGQLPRA